ncbi:unnamed protein product, partial [Meganyctiphanes norvegica]
WVNARRTGWSSHQWMDDGTELNATQLWLPRVPNSGGGLEDCVSLGVWSINITDIPSEPYWVYPCSSSFSKPLCEGVAPNIAKSVFHGVEFIPDNVKSCIDGMIAQMNNMRYIRECNQCNYCKDPCTRWCTGSCSCVQKSRCKDCGPCMRWHSLKCACVKEFRCKAPTTTENTTPTTPISSTIESSLSLESCALPLIPSTDPDAVHTGAMRFGSRRDSRIEYSDLPSNPRDDFKFSFDFKTTADEGIFFYGADENHKDFISIYMKDSLLVFSYNPGAGAIVMRSSQSVNDDEWHSVIAERENEMGRLFVDGNLTSYNRSPRDANFKHIDIMTPYYVGGLSNLVTQISSSNTADIDQSLIGCIRDMKLNNVEFGSEKKVISVQRCSDKVEPGMFLGIGPQSHVIFREQFSVGRVFKLTMDVKPRVNTGVLMSLHGKSDFVMLQMKNGIVELSVDYGKGIIIAKYEPMTPWSLCDGRWHKVKVIKRKKRVVLVVDEHHTKTKSRKKGDTFTDKKYPLFLGTQPNITDHRGHPTTDKYVGCIKNVHINKKADDFSYPIFVGNVDAGSCPTI